MKRKKGVRPLTGFVRHGNMRTKRNFDYKTSDPIVTTTEGGKQSELNLRFDLIDSQAMMRLGAVLDHGEKRYGEENWRLIPVSSHINRAIYHLYKYLEVARGQSRDNEDHLGHALCRAMFATALEKGKTK